MNHTEANHKKEIRADNVKVIVCVLTVLGHFFRSMTKSNILPANDLYEWFEQMVYFFRVPLFFIHSGYLYRGLSRVNDVYSQGRSVFKKVLALSVPYFTFSFATWLLKTLLSESVNSEIGELSEALFLDPASPYWYLYCLFFTFLMTPTFKSAQMAIVGLALTLTAKTVPIIGEGFNVWVWG